MNGELVSCEAYEIDGQVWFKLRDVALALSRTGSRFLVDWDPETRTVLLTTGKAYEPDGNEGTSEDDESASAIPSRHAVSIDGEEQTCLPA